MKPQRIVIAGGSGQVGNLLARAFQRDGHDIVVLSRTPKSAPWRMVAWDGETIAGWAAELEGADVVINLAGKSVNCRYTPRNRELITESRVRSTSIVGHAIRDCAKPPRLWLQASSATLYAHRYDVANDEDSGIIASPETDRPDTWQFSIGVVKEWEQALNSIQTPRTRKVLLRTSMVMSPDHGGAFDVLLNLVRHGLGGHFGNGRQYMSWIHHQDFVRAMQWIIEHENLAGPLIIASPNPLPNREFMRELRAAAGMSFGLPTPKWLLEIGAFLMRTESELMLKSRRVSPGRLLRSGFAFGIPDWPTAARELCNAWRKVKSVYGR